MKLIKSYIVNISFLSVLMLFLISPFVWANEIRKKTNIEMMWSQVLDKNPMLKESSEKIIENEAEYQKKKSFPNPQIAFENMGNNESQWSFIQKVPSFLGWYYLSHSGDLKKKLKANELEASTRELRSKFLGLYFDSYLLAKKKLLLEDQQKLWNQWISSMRNQYVTEKISQSELLNAQIQKAKVTEDILQIESEIIEKSSQLKSLTGLEIDLSQIALESNKKWKSFGDKKEKIVESILAQSPQLIGLKSEMEAEENEISFVKTQFIPDLELMLTRKESQAGENTNGYKITLGLPLWGGGETRGELQMAKSKYVMAQARYENTKREILTQLEYLIQKYDLNLKKKELYEGGLLTWTQQAYLSSQSAYKAGKIKYSEILTILNNYFQSQFNFEETIVNLYKIEAELDKYVDINEVILK